MNSFNFASSQDEPALGSSDALFRAAVRAMRDCSCNEQSDAHELEDGIGLVSHLSRPVHLASFLGSAKKSSACVRITAIGPCSCLLRTTGEPCLRKSWTFGRLCDFIRDGGGSQVVRPSFEPGTARDLEFELASKLILLGNVMLHYATRTLAKGKKNGREIENSVLEIRDC
jgi:hypothetical protein